MNKIKKNSFIEGAFITTLAIILTKAMGLLYVIPFYTIIGKQGGALYSYSYNIYTIFLAISTAGIPSAISKIITEYDTLKLEEAKIRTFKITKTIILVMSIICFSVMFIFSKNIATLIIGPLDATNKISDISFTIRCQSFAVIIVPILSISKGFIQGHKIMLPSSVSSVIEQAVRIFVILLGSYVALKILKLKLKISVGIAVSGAFFGALIALLYLKYIIRKNKKIFKIKKYKRKDKIENKEIILKIFKYSVPFIITSIATNIYTFTDMILIIRGLLLFHYEPFDIEFIQSAITTWSNKICAILSSISLGLSISLIPNIVSSYVKENFKEVESKLNQAIKIILVSSVPLIAGINVLSEPIWTLFYGPSHFGPIILKMLCVSVLFSNIYNITLSTLQGLNKFKIVYISTISGFLVNAFLDIPYMFLMNYFNLPEVWGPIISSITGFTISILISIKMLNKIHKITLKSTFKTTFKIIITACIMSIILVCFNSLIGFNVTKKISSMIMVLTNVIIAAPIYIFGCYKLGVFDDIFGKNCIKSLINRFTSFKKS